MKKSRHPSMGQFITIFCLLNGRRSTIINMIFLIFLCSIEELLIYHLGLLSAQFYYILVLKDIYKFYIQLIVTFLLIAFMALIKSSKNYVSSVLYIEWREHLSRLLIDRYFDLNNYYFVNFPNTISKAALNRKYEEPTNLDNVDQRMSQDVDKICAELSTIISQIILSPFTIIYYSIQVYHTVGLFGLISCISLFLVSTFVNRYFIKSIIKWTYLKGKHEGDYRNEHANISKHSEQIAFADCENLQKSKILTLLKNLLSVHENLILSQFYLNLSTSVFDYSGSILSFLIIAFPIFGGYFDNLNEAEMTRKISTNTFICLYLINCFTRIIDISSNFGHINGFGYRIIELIEKLESNKDYKIKNSFVVQSSVGSPLQREYVRFTNVTFTSLFSDKQVVKNLSFLIRKNENLYITGDSGLGKTSILRIIKGFWPLSGGFVECNLDVNNPNQVMFVLHNSKIAQIFLQVSLYFFTILLY